mgnify:CR=1 FL=1
MAISINPFITTNAAGTFSVYSDGYVQGEAMDDPAVRYQLTSGPLASTETLPMWGGVAVSQVVPASSVMGAGGAVARATSLANHIGFSVFNQSYAWVVTPQSPVPLATTGMSVGFYRFGSNARIPVQCTSTLAAALVSGATNQQVLWDYTNQALIAYTSGTALPVQILDVQIGNSKTVSYNSGTGFATYINTGTTALIQI